MSRIKQLLKRIAYSVSVIALAATPVFVPVQASAAALTTRSVLISNPQSAATGVTYTFTFTAPSATTVQSVAFQFCAAASGACVTPGSFAAGSAALVSQPTGLGSGGAWTVNNASNSIRILNASNTGSPGAVTAAFNTVTNPTLTNATFFVRITTYSDSAWSTSIDTGTVAASTSGLITVNASVDETLTFTLASGTVTLSPNPITTGAASTGTTTLVASTNAQSGYVITYSSPNALKPVGGVALPSYSGSASAPGTAGFGINLVANTTPSVGSAVSGGVGSATAPYATANSFTFVGANTATQIASTGNAPSNASTYTVSYVANIASATPAGAYTTTFSYVATPTF